MWSLEDLTVPQGDHKMFNLFRLVVQWLGARRQPHQIALEPEAMSLHDWADLPAYHPVCD